MRLIDLFLCKMRVIISILLFIHSVTFVINPLGCTSPLNLHDMYEQCSREDNDITPLDFVFEHLLNFESVIQYFEGETEDEHESHKSLESIIEVTIIIPEPLHFHFYPKRRYFDIKEYPVLDTKFHPSSFFPEILRPPIV